MSLHYAGYSYFKSAFFMRIIKSCVALMHSTGAMVCVLRGRGVDKERGDGRRGGCLQ